MPDYQKGKIYKLVCNITGDVYYGSTIQSLAVRKGGHIQDYKNYKNEKRPYITSFKIIENGDYDVILVENFPCKNKEELHARERYYIDNFECINKYKPGRTPAQYYTDNKIKIIGQVKQYREENKEKIQESKKQYYENNKETFKKKNEQYRKDNKEKIQESKNKKYSCECGGKYMHSNKNRHLKTQSHIKYLESLKDN